MKRRGNLPRFRRIQLPGRSVGNSGLAVGSGSWGGGGGVVSLGGVGKAAVGVAGAAALTGGGSAARTGSVALMREVPNGAGADFGACGGLTAGVARRIGRCTGARGVTCAAEGGSAGSAGGTGRTNAFAGTGGGAGMRIGIASSDGSQMVGGMAKAATARAPIPTA